MKFQIVMATMDRQRDDIAALMDNNGITCDALVINQCGRNDTYQIERPSQTMTIVEMQEKGLSKSRNMALTHSHADVCLIADDDIAYVHDVEETIITAFANNPDFDIIAFYVERSASFHHKAIGQMHEVKKFASLGLMSVQIALRRASILDKGLQFDTRFGAGSSCFICGEENIFLMDCLKKGLRILYVPETIAATSDNESSWFHGYDALFFNSKGAVFYRLFPHLSIVMIVVFAITKYHEYGAQATRTYALKEMLKGRKAVKSMK